MITEPLRTMVRIRSGAVSIVSAFEQRMLSQGNTCSLRVSQAASTQHPIPYETA